MTHYLYCPCGRCPIRPMRAGEAPRCCAEDGSVAESMAFLMRLGSMRNADGSISAYDVRDLAVQARLDVGRPTDPRDEWVAWLDSQIEADRRCIALQVEIDVPTWQAEGRLRKRLEMAASARTAEPTWLGDRREQPSADSQT